MANPAVIAAAVVAIASRSATRMAPCHRSSTLCALYESAKRKIRIVESSIFLVGPGTVENRLRCRKEFGADDGLEVAFRIDSPAFIDYSPGIDWLLEERGEGLDADWLATSGFESQRGDFSMHLGSGMVSGCYQLEASLDEWGDQGVDLQARRIRSCSRLAIADRRLKGPSSRPQRSLHSLLRPLRPLVVVQLSAGGEYILRKPAGRRIVDCLGRGTQLDSELFQEKSDRRVIGHLPCESADIVDHVGIDLSSIDPTMFERREQFGSIRGFGGLSLLNEKTVNAQSLSLAVAPTCAFLGREAEISHLLTCGDPAIDYGAHWLLLLPNLGFLFPLAEDFYRRVRNVVELSPQ